MSSQLPGARAAIADKQGLPTPEFYRFLLGLQRLSDGSASAADITALQAQIAAIQSEIDGLPKSSFPTLQVAVPVYSQGLLQNGFAKIGVNVANSVIVNGTALQLDGDAAAPGNTYLYSTGLTGTKGWNALSGMLHQSANVAVTFGADGTATFDLQPLADSGAGTFKLITRDSYGRLAGTKAGTTSDVPEGTNLYFTASRVLATVLAGLSTATNAVITAADTVLVALGKLQAQITANVTAIAGKLAKSANLSDLADAATARGNLGVVIPQGYIDGLQMVWNSATSISVTSGAAYIPSLGNVLASNATLTLSGLSLAASTWYHVYLYSNAGTPAIECVTVGPGTPYSGSACAKSGDSSRRYVGSFLTDGSGGIYEFNSCAKSSSVDIAWVAQPNELPWRILGSGASTVPTNISLAAVNPSVNVIAKIKVILTLTIGPGVDMLAGVGTQLSGAINPSMTGESYLRLQNTGTNDPAYLFLPPSEVMVPNGNLQYCIQVLAGSGTSNLSVDVRGITLSR